MVQRVTNYKEKPYRFMSVKMCNKLHSTCAHLSNSLLYVSEEMEPIDLDFNRVYFALHIILIPFKAAIKQPSGHSCPFLWKSGKIDRNLQLGFSPSGQLFATTKPMV